jgi:hypothetical protein
MPTPIRKETELPPAVKRQIDSLCGDVRSLAAQVNKQEVRLRALKDANRKARQDLNTDIKLLTKLVRTLIEEAQRHVRKS